MPETRHFINSGYGWTCKHCRAADAAAPDHNTSDERMRARFFHEGEAEERGEPILSAQALARWRDPAHDTLVCPRCGVEEETRGYGDEAK